MATIVILHSVTDYGEWRVVYEEAESLRTKHGYTGASVMQAAGDPSSVLVTHDFPTIEQARAFTEDPELKAVMAKAGVVGQPRIEFYVSAG